MPHPTCGRRSFLRLTALTPLTACIGPQDEARVGALLVSANDSPAGQHRLSGLDLATGAIVFELPLAARGHGATAHPYRSEVLLADRRPGSRLHLVDLKTGSLKRTVATKAERHFFGHTVYDAPRRLLYATENCFDAAVVPDLTPQESVIGVYDVEREYKRIDELPSYGIGAHQLQLMPDGDTLVVANGGIYTHPSLDREGLNLDSMAANLAYVDIETGELLEQVSFAQPQLSIRHLAVSPTGLVAVALQYEGPAADSVPLVATHQRGRALTPLWAPERQQRALEQYIASVVLHPALDRIAASAPRGNVVVQWDLSGTYVGALTLPDVAGLGVIDDAFVASSGNGSVVVTDARSLRVRHQVRIADARWDNHLLIVN